jgi:phosphoribosylaminoimidazole-succinocarboxamide synthase
MSEAITTIDVQGKLPKVASGKVRDLFAVDDNTLLFVASDRISAYDVIMENVSGRKRKIGTRSKQLCLIDLPYIMLTHPQGIPGKGALLTQMRYNIPHEKTH